MLEPSVAFGPHEWNEALGAEVVALDAPFLGIDDPIVLDAQLGIAPGFESAIVLEATVMTCGMRDGV